MALCLSHTCIDVTHGWFMLTNLSIQQWCALVASGAAAAAAAGGGAVQFFAPYAAIGGLEMPAAVYLIDMLKPGFQVQQVLELIQPVLASGSNVKVNSLSS